MAAQVAAPAPRQGLAFVGSAACASCHAPEARAWAASHHARAMQHATAASVLGDFADRRFAQGAAQARFLRQGGRFYVETAGADGRAVRFAVAFAFGVAPLQQYLVALPGGRLQALPFAWDARPKSQGGQRWFDLYPGVGPKDALFWTKPYQNGNFMCAGCHTTGFAKNYDDARDRFQSAWAELGVGCEDCHGQGSAHVAWARGRAWAGEGDGLPVHFDERKDVAWLRVAASGNARRSVKPALLRKEVETCGLCHARATPFSEDWRPGRWLAESHDVEPLVQGLYEADGTMKDEVYNYGSFKQSKMFAEGVTCSDCHEPHSGGLRAPGNGVCAQCHAPARYDASAHSHHAALACADCHMPARLYMGVDRRHDHGFRVPRPDLSATLGTPNACNDCHKDKSAPWAATAVARWFGPSRRGFQTYAPAFQAAWTGAPDAGARLAAVIGDAATPAFARAGAFAALAAESSAIDPAALAAGLRDRDPMVRSAALDALDARPSPSTVTLAAPLLSDPVEGVRLAAAWALAGAPLPPPYRAAFARAAGEFVAAQHLNADRAEAHARLGGFYARQGASSAAEAEFRAGLARDPGSAANAVDLADLYRQTGRDGLSEAVLRQAIEAAPADARLRLAHGLALARLGRSGEALGEFARAGALSPEDAVNGYVYGVALDGAGRPAQALAVLKANLARHPGDRDTLAALVSFSRKAGDPLEALDYARRLKRAAPDERGLDGLIAALEAEARRR